MMGRRSFGRVEQAGGRRTDVHGARRGARAVIGALVLGFLAVAPGSALEKDPSPLFWATMEAAEWGDADAQFAVGMMYLDGQDVDANAEEAANWLKQAHDQGHPQATYQLGELYQQGKGVPKDEKLATEYFKRAGQRGGTGVSAEQRVRTQELRLRQQEMEFEKEQQRSRQQHELKILKSQQRHQKKLQRERNDRYYRGSTRYRGSRRRYR